MSSETSSDTLSTVIEILDKSFNLNGDQKKRLHESRLQLSLITGDSLDVTQLAMEIEERFGLDSKSVDPFLQDQMSEAGLSVLVSGIESLRSKATSVINS